MYLVVSKLSGTLCHLLGFLGITTTSSSYLVLISSTPPLEPWTKSRTNNFGFPKIELNVPTKAASRPRKAA